jgi:hypothetical protein
MRARFAGENWAASSGTAATAFQYASRKSSNVANALFLKMSATCVGVGPSIASDSHRLCTTVPVPAATPGVYLGLALSVFFSRRLRFASRVASPRVAPGDLVRGVVAAGPASGLIVPKSKAACVWTWSPPSGCLAGAATRSSKLYAPGAASDEGSCSVGDVTADASSLLTRDDDGSGVTSGGDPWLGCR